MKTNIKNLISSRRNLAIVIIATIVLGLGSIPSRAPAQALGASYFLNNTTLNLSGLAGTMVIEAGSNVDSLTTAGTSAFTIVMSAGQIFTIRSSDRYTFDNDQSYSTTCGGTQSSLTISLGQTASSKTIVVTPSSTACTQSSGSPGGGGGGSSGSAGGGGDSSYTAPTPTPTPSVVSIPVPTPTPTVVGQVVPTPVPGSSVQVAFNLPANLIVNQGSSLKFKYNVFNNSGATATYRVVRDLISSSDKLIARYETSSKITKGKSSSFSPTQPIAATRATGVYTQRVSIYQGNNLIARNQFNFTVVAKGKKVSVAPTQAVASSGLAISTNLSQGSRGVQVQVLQEKLKKLGFFPADTDTSNLFGTITLNAVKAFQKSRGLPTVGNVGPSTRAELNK